MLFHNKCILKILFSFEINTNLPDKNSGKFSVYHNGTIFISGFLVILVVDSGWELDTLLATLIGRRRRNSYVVDRITLTF